MRLLPSIRFGTERYPEKVARRLRGLNIATWLAAATHACYALVLFFGSTQLWRLGVGNVVAALLYAGVPLLHRLGHLAGPLAVIIVFDADMLVFICLIGTGIGIQLYFLIGAALTVLYLGTEYVALTSASGAVAAALIIVVQVMVPYDTGLLSATVFYLSVIINAVVSCGALLLIVFYALREAARAEAIAQFEHERSESLLANILPAPIAERLKSNPDSIADSFSEATILFVDIVGFTKLSESMAPEDVVYLLNKVFSEIDDLTEKYDLEKIKTIGDAYMVVAGAPERRPDHAEAIAAMSLEIKDSFAKLNIEGQHSLDFRIGIHSGPVVAGVIGKKKFSYDMWGDSVNTAARMESHGIPGEIHVSAEVQDLLKDKFLFVERGLVDIKGKGELFTYLLKGRRVEGRLANANRGSLPDTATAEDIR